MPLVARDEIELHRSVVDELVIRIGNWKRNVSLPTGLARLDISGAKYEEDRLNIFFDAADTREMSAEELRSSRWDNLKARFLGT